MNRHAAQRPATIVRESTPGDAWAGARPWEVGYDLGAALGPLRDLADPAVPRVACLAVQAVLVVSTADALAWPEPPGPQRRAARDLVRAAGSSALRRRAITVLRASRRLAIREDRHAARGLYRALGRLAEAAPGPCSAAACTRLAFAIAARHRIVAAARASAARLARVAAAHGASRDAERWGRWARPAGGG